MRKTKRLLFLVLTVVVALAMGSMPVFAADAPVYDEENGIFYANGTAITISENADGETEITWAGGSQVVTDDTSVFGGGQPGTSYSSSRITMNSGTVAYIFGGGDGSTTQSADVSSAHIEINDGSVTSTIYGGGSLSSHVGTANIVINGGNHFDMCGGGGASGNESVGSADDAENSPLPGR